LSMTNQFPERFMNKVEITKDCWIWKAANTPRGYGIFTVKKKNIYAHRYSWSFVNGEIPEGMVICHRCDNPSCVNPDHLFIGTQKENLDDMKNKGRSPVGEKHRTKTHPELVLRGEQIGTSKLSEEQVRKIREEYRPGKPGVKSETSLTGLAKKYGVNFQTISKIINNKRWVNYE
jgi:hypothetical protein